VVYTAECLLSVKFCFRWPSNWIPIFCIFTENVYLQANDVDSPDKRELPPEDPAVNSSTAGTSKLHVNGAGEGIGSILASVYFSRKSSHAFSEKIFQQITHTCFALLQSHRGH
jgi:hypothetical protein